MPKPVKWKHENSSDSSKPESIIDLMIEKPFSTIRKNIVVSDPIGYIYNINTIKLAKTPSRIHISLFLKEGGKIYFFLLLSDSDYGHSLLIDSHIKYVNTESLIDSSREYESIKPIPIVVEITEDGLNSIHKWIKKEAIKTETPWLFREVLD